MPELPEVETVRRGLLRLMKGRRIKKLTLRRKDLRAPFPPGMEKMLTGRRVEDVERRAKYLLIRLSGGKTLLAHLGMSGRMAAQNLSTKPGKHDHVLIDLDNNTRITFNDPRRFGVMDVFDTEEEAENRWLRHLGAEPLSKNLNAAFLAQKFRGKKLAVKLAIMDQRLVVGVGNIYASEALFYARISPRKAAGKVKSEALQRLAPAIRKVLEKSIAHGGSSLRDYVQADGELGSFQDKFAVYGRDGEKCPGCVCDIKETGGVQCITQGARSTFYCPVKQK